MRKKYKSALSFAIGAAALASMILASPEQPANAAEASAYQQIIEFEDANNFESNGSNRIESSQFSNYSGSGYLYLVSGWGEVNFSVPQAGDLHLYQQQSKCRIC